MMHGIAFANLPQLAEVDFWENACINRLFTVGGDSNNFLRKISRNCASANVVKKQLSCSASTACDEKRSVEKCCEMDYGTVIDTPDQTFLADTNYATIAVLLITHQPNVEFLPVLVHERFPALNSYEVVNAPVQKISKKNFEKMYELEWLTLERNKIEVIRSDTFEDLISLKFI